MKKLLIFAFLVSYSFIGQAMKSNEHGLDSEDMKFVRRVMPCAIATQSLEQRCLNLLEKELGEASLSWVLKSTLNAQPTDLRYGLDLGPILRFNNDAVVVFGCQDITREERVGSAIPSRVICNFAKNKTTEFDAQGNIISGAKNFWMYRTNNNILFLVNKELIPQLIEKYGVISKQDKKN